MNTCTGICIQSQSGMSGIDKEKLIIFRKIMNVDNEIRFINCSCSYQYHTLILGQGWALAPMSHGY